MPYWLMKSEPADVSIDDLAALPQQTVPWYGVRNYQARNFMRDGMQVGDGVLFYHSGCAEPGIAGLARVASTAYPDATQFDPASRYFDPRATPESPRWLHVDVQFVRKTRLVGCLWVCPSCAASRNWRTCASLPAATGSPSLRWNRPSGASSSGNCSARPIW